MPVVARGWAARHVHYVIEPVTQEQIADGVYGPRLQVAMFIAGEPPDPVEVERFADRARAQLTRTAP